MERFALFFRDAWYGHTPKTSRLVHGAGIVALGYVMEVLAQLEGARTEHEFCRGLACLVDRTAWTNGDWNSPGGIVGTGKQFRTLTAIL
jgi:hypothetical protein